MTEQVRVNKTAIVRNILRDIGALNANPPEGWRQQVEEALKKQNLSMHQVTIYQIRSKELKAKGEAKAAKAKGRPKSVAAPTATAVPAQANGKLTVSDLKTVQELAKNLGGLDALSEAISAIKSFQG